MSALVPKQVEVSCSVFCSFRYTTETDKQLHYLYNNQKSYRYTCYHYGISADIQEYKSKRRARQKRKRKMKEEQRRIKEGLQKGTLRPADQNETLNEVVSNWGAAQAMAAAKRDDKAAQPVAGVKRDDYFQTPLERAGAPPKPQGAKGTENSKEPRDKRSTNQKKFRPRNDNETLNEVVSNWGAAQAMMRKKETKRKGNFRPANDNETINEVVSNWGAAQAMMEKRDGEGPPEIRPKLDPIVVAPAEGNVRKRNDFETIDECVSNWGPMKAFEKKQSS